MKDLQRQRLTNLMAGAILSLWKKETGSLSSVVIEGTICITTLSGKTTVVQVADRFGSRDECEQDDELDHMDSSQVDQSVSLLQHATEYTGTKSLYTDSSRAEQSSENSYKKNLSQSDSSLGVRKSSVCVVADGDDSSLDDEIKLQIIEDVDINHNNVDMASKNADKEKRPHSRPVSPVTSPVEVLKRSISVNAFGERTSTRTNSSAAAVDLSMRDVDLALSSPYSYTAQVRDVIKQRLMAKSSNESTNKVTDVQESKQSLKRTDSTEDVRSSEQGSPDVKKTKSSLTVSLNPVTVLSPPISERSPFIRPGVPMSPLNFGMFASTNLNKFPGSPKTSTPNAKYPGLLWPVVGMPTWTPTTPPSQTSAGSSGLSLDSSASSSEMSPDLGETTLGSKQKVYRCEYCAKVFLFKSKYHEHLPVHTNQRPFQCRLCSRTYKYKYDLSVHLRTHMGIPTKSTVCPFCNAKFDTNKILRAHITESHFDKIKSDDDMPSLITPPST